MGPVERCRSAAPRGTTSAGRAGKLDPVPGVRFLASVFRARGFLLAHPFQLVLYQGLDWLGLGRIIGMTQQCPQSVPANQQQAAASAEVAPNGYNFTKKKKWPHRASHKANKPQLLTRDRLDGRRNAVATFDKHAREIQRDLGGADQLSAIQLDLIEAFVGEALVMQTMNAKVMLGE